MQRAPARAAQRAQRVVEERLQQEEHREPEKAEAMDHRVEHVDADGRPVGDRLHRTPALQRPDDGDEHEDLDQPDQQPAGGVEGVFRPATEADGINEGLHGRLEEPALQR